jgi:high-affinity K+ transport system ATPase subunit B
MVYWKLIYTSCNKKMVLTSEKNIIATSSSELLSAVLYRALMCTGVIWRDLACSGVLWRALACTGVLWRALV